jgi:hypothetical protein
VYKTLKLCKSSHSQFVWKINAFRRCLNLFSKVGYGLYIESYGSNWIVLSFNKDDLFMFMLMCFFILFNDHVQFHPYAHVMFILMHCSCSCSLYCACSCSCSCLYSCQCSCSYVHIFIFMFMLIFMFLFMFTFMLISMILFTFHEHVHENGHRQEHGHGQGHGHEYVQGYRA